MESEPLPIFVGVEKACELLAIRKSHLYQMTKKGELWIMGDADAHTVLQSIYLDPEAPQANRLKAASAALPVEKPKLMSVGAPLELTAVVVPLTERLEQRRARQDHVPEECGIIQAQRWPLQQGLGAGSRAAATAMATTSTDS